VWSGLVEEEVEAVQAARTSMDCEYGRRVGDVLKLSAIGDWRGWGGSQLCDLRY
jgi:hypothetical protein